MTWYNLKICNCCRYEHPAYHYSRVGRDSILDCTWKQNNNHYRAQVHFTGAGRNQHQYPHHETARPGRIDQRKVAYLQLTRKASILERNVLEHAHNHRHHHHNNWQILCLKEYNYTSRRAEGVGPNIRHVMLKDSLQCYSFCMDKLQTQVQLNPVH